MQRDELQQKSIPPPNLCVTKTSVVRPSCKHQHCPRRFATASTRQPVNEWSLTDGRVPSDHVITGTKSCHLHLIDLFSVEGFRVVHRCASIPSSCCDEFQGSEEEETRSSSEFGRWRSFFNDRLSSEPPQATEAVCSA